MNMKPYRITVHCADTPNGKIVPADEIRKWHLARGWNDIGYHLVIQPTGEVERGRGLNEQGAHVEGANEGNIGICLPGTDRFTARAFSTLRYQIDSIRMNYGISEHELYCHNQFKSAQEQGKTCPNMSINRLLAWYLLKDEKMIQPYLIEETSWNY